MTHETINTELNTLVATVKQIFSHEAFLIFAVGYVIGWAFKEIGLIVLVVFALVIAFGLGK